MWIDRSYVPAGLRLELSRPTTSCGSASARSIPRFHVREPTVRLASDLHAETVRYQGNWIPHALRDATEDGVFFVGDSAGHCLPLTAEGIRTALYFGLACGRELRARDRGTQVARAGAGPLPRVLGRATRRRFAGCCASSVWSRGSRRACSVRSLRAIGRKRFIDWAFGHYLKVAHPDFVGGGAPRAGARA